MSKDVTAAQRTSFLSWQKVFLPALLLLTVGTYHGVVRNGFVVDDAYTIVDNRAIDSFGEAWRWLTEPETASSLRETNYRPVLVASFALDVAWWGRSPAGFHAVNLALHLVAVLLVYRLGLILWGRAGSAAAAAAVMALHPLNAEAVNYVSARSSLLSAVLILAAITVHERARQRAHGAAGLRLWALALGAAALGTKETAVILPLLVIVWDRAAFSPGEGWGVTIRRAAPWGLLTAAYLGWRSVVLGGGGAGMIGDGPWQPILFGLKILLSSLGHWWMPVGLAIDHGWPWTIGSGEGAVLGVLAFMAAGGTFAAFRFDRRIGWCVAWFWVALFPVLALPLVSRLTLYQDHRVYLAGVGMAWAVGELLRRVAERIPARRRAAVTALAVVVFAVGMIRADVGRTAVWRDADRLWDDVLARYPSSVMARNHQGVRRLAAGDIAQAQAAFEASVRLAPGFAVTHNYLGVALAKLGAMDEATAEFETAVRLSPLFVTARLNLGNAYERAGRFEAALDIYEREVPDEPWAVELWERSARLLVRMGRPDEAQGRARRLLALEPDHEWARKMLGQPP